MGTIKYRELKSFDEFKECISLQKKTFKLSDMDVTPLPILNVFARDFPPVGIVIGAFDIIREKEEMVGFFFSTAVLNEPSYMGLLAGVLPEYEGRNIGTELFRKLREFSLPRNVKYMYGYYDPLESILGHSYFNKLGFWGIKFQESAYELASDDSSSSKREIPIDKIVVKWEFDSQRTCEKIEGIYPQKKIEDVLSKFPVINEDNFEDSDTVLVKIPEDFVALKKTNFEEALNWRFKTRNIFNEYINKRGYWITEFYSQKKDGKRHNFYLLEKQ